MTFVDEAIIPVQGGRGGNGCVAFRREKFVPNGGPAGGDGGAGGSVWLAGDGGKSTLHHLRFPGQFKAERGRHGEGSNRTGRTGEDLIISVPLGTQAFDHDTGVMLGEVLEEGQRLRVAAGGRGGQGNARFRTSTRQAPRFAQPGEEAEERLLRLELKLLADVGVVGLPNAGKSTLISTISAAHPKIADYPFTTLIPQLGVVAPDPVSDPFVIADLPGLIEGAAAGAGLGTRFLRHTERCRLLLHMVDLSSFEETDARRDLEIIEKEMARFNQDLMERPRILVGSKLDAARSERRDQLREAAKDKGLPYLEVSSAAGMGLKELVRLVQKMLSEIPLDPRGRDNDDPDLESTDP